MDGALAAGIPKNAFSRRLRRIKHRRPIHVNHANGKGRRFFAAGTEGKSMKQTVAVMAIILALLLVVSG